jgi:hypothetical protein
MASTLLTACGAGDMNEFDVGQKEFRGDEDEYSSEEIELGSVEQAAHNCSTLDGTNSVMAALAVAAANELGRWNAGVDFQVNGDRIGLASGNDSKGKPRGRNRCTNSCKGIDALLSLQNDNAKGVYVQGETSNKKVLVNPGALRSRMKAKLEEQRTKDATAEDGRSGGLPAKTGHTLTGAGTANLGGCGPHFKFKVAFDAIKPPPPSNKKPLPAQLRYSLYFADQANGWVDFRDLGNNVVAIDPTYGLNEGSSTSAGSCEIACTKVSTKKDVSNTCCSCAGATKKFKKSTFSTSVFLCQ